MGVTVCVWRGLCCGGDKVGGPGRPAAELPPPSCRPPPPLQHHEALPHHASPPTAPHHHRSRHHHHPHHSRSPAQLWWQLWPGVHSQGAHHRCIYRVQFVIYLFIFFYLYIYYIYFFFFGGGRVGWSSPPASALCHLKMTSGNTIWLKSCFVLTCLCFVGVGGWSISGSQLKLWNLEICHSLKLMLSYEGYVCGS